LAVLDLFLAVRLWLNNKQKIGIKMSPRTKKHGDGVKPLSNPQPVTNFQSGVDWRFFGWWVLGNIVGIGLAVVMGLIGASDMLAVLVRIALWGVVGAVVGIIQQLVLQRQVYPGNWVWVTIVGWTVGGIVAGREGVDWGVIGGMVGTMQWFILRHHTHRAGWWVLANAIGLIFGASTGWSIRFTSRWVLFRELTAIDEHVIEAIDWIVAGIAGGTIYGIITGLWLVWLLSLRGRNMTNYKTRLYVLEVKR
jgi:hypothetical protein